MVLHNMQQQIKEQWSCKDENDIEACKSDVKGLMADVVGRTVFAATGLVFLFGFFKTIRRGE